MATLVSPGKNGGQDSTPLYVSPATIRFKPSELGVVKAKYQRRAVVKCIEHLPVPYIIEIPKSDRFAITSLGNGSEWHKGCIDSGMDGIPLVITFKHPVSGETDYIYDNFQTVVYDHTPGGCLNVIIQAIRNDTEDEFSPERLPLPHLPIESEFPKVTLIADEDGFLDTFNDSMGDELSMDSLHAVRGQKGEDADGFQNHLPDYPDSPVREIGGSKKGQENYSLPTESSNEFEGKVQHEDDEKDFYKKLISKPATVTAAEDNKAPVKDDKKGPMKDARVESMEDAREMIKRMRMGRSTRTTSSTFAGTGNNIVQRAGESSRLIAKAGGRGEDNLSPKGRHTMEELNFYKSFIDRKMQEDEREKRLSNPYDASIARERARRIDRQIEKSNPLLAQTKRRVTPQKKAGIGKSPKFKRHTRIVLSSSSDEEDCVDRVNRSSSIEFGHSSPARRRNVRISPSPIRSTGMKNSPKNRESPINTPRTNIIMWSSGSDNEEMQCARSFTGEKSSLPKVHFDEEEIKFYNTLAMSTANRSHYEEEIRQTLSESAPQKLRSQEDTSLLDRASQAEYESRLRAALADVTMEAHSPKGRRGYSQGRRRSKLASTTSTLHERGRARKPVKRYIPKNENLIKVSDWL